MTSKDMIHQLKFLGMAILGTQLMACAATQSADFSVIHQANQCAYAEASIIQLDSVEQQTRVINKLLPFGDAPARNALRKQLSQHERNEKLFLIAQGSKPTPGYGFEVSAKVATIENETLQLPIRFSVPDKDMMLAQVLTSPCLIVGIDAKAHYLGIQADGLVLDLRVNK